MQKTKPGVVRRLMAYLRPRKKTVALALLLAMVVTVSDLVRPVLVGNAMDSITAGSTFSVIVRYSAVYMGILVLGIVAFGFGTAGGVLLAKLMNIFSHLGVEEGDQIEHKMLSNAIENAQKNVESRNFQMRKNVLEYDDVMNTQRQVIYEQRQKVLDGEDLSSTIEGMIHYVIDTEVEDAFAGADHCDDPEKLAQINAKFEGVYYPKGAFAPQPGLSREEAKEQLYPLFRQTYAAREQEFGAERMREIERIILLRVVDEYWMDNIDAMEDLKQGIRLRAYGQTDPVVAYKREGFAMFDGMINAIREETVRRLYLFRLRTEEDIRRKQVAKITATGGAADKTVKQQPVKKIKIGANDPCPCGSGKKYKYCCRDKDEAKS